ncbi:DUF349 domain-containing protein [Aestuariibacter sp. AA17]|uniref:DUF349 domain-containing protein n=1 Tax=Fluctibacter corallii TaxID=2984329 RepID=A0ABT3A7D8_9ALTE|nr:DUF349 domain-containing protein [Aestuariibacter sp. AA17]MCV2884236.1 DUF349 domain-containing protein [Aestuariibacter sp. AA17]
MIFKTLFRPKFKHTDPKIRLASIQDLDASNNEHKQALHELAFNDEDTNVRIAALEQLNSFTLWSKSADSSDSEKVKRLAKKRVEATLLGKSDIQISDSDRLTYIEQSGNNALLESMLKSLSHEKESTLVLHILAHLGKEHVTRQVLLSSPSETIQLALLDKIHDKNTLQKLLKRTTFQTVKDKINHELLVQHERLTKPIELEKQITLTLSKLFSLKESQNLPHIREQLALESANYEAQTKQLVVWSEEKAHACNEKYASIHAQIQKHIASLEPQWRDKEAKALLQQNAEALNASAQVIIEQVQARLSTDLHTITEAESTKLSAQLKAISDDMERLRQSAQQQVNVIKLIEHTLNRVTSLTYTLATIPAFQHAVKDAQALIDDLKAMPEPTSLVEAVDIENDLNARKQILRELIKPFRDNWPKPLKDEERTATSKLQQAIATRKEEEKKHVTKCLGKISASKRMIEQGRFKAAFAIFDAVLELYNGLSERGQLSVKRKFEALQTDIENLKGWQTYIAAPRKPELLEQVKALIENPLSPQKQADEVKRLRKNWRSLGRSETSEQQALDTEFEALLETAFQPCRDHYESERVKRADNEKRKRALIADIQHYVEQVNGESERDIVKAYQGFTRQWREIGEVDFKVVPEISEHYSEAIAQLKQRVTAIYTANETAKAQLVKQAAGLISMDNIDEAAEIAKTLQQKWKEVGPTQRKVDNTLWTEFREANDAVFTVKATKYQAQKQEDDEIASSCKIKLEALEQQIQSAETQQVLSDVDNTLENIAKLWESLPPKRQLGLTKRAEGLAQLAKSKRAEFTKASRQEQVSLLINSLQRWKDKNTAPDVEAFDSRYKSWFTSSDNAQDRRKLLVEMESIAGLHSPDEDSQLRSELQVALMAQKLETGTMPDIQSLGKSFVSQGPLSEEEMDMLPRFKKVLESQVV